MGVKDFVVESGSLNPAIFILSAGVDPSASIFKAAESTAHQIYSISMGQGQGKKAEGLIAQAQEEGSWVLLQNCHLAISWMPVLEALVAGLPSASLNPEFRLILTSKPSADFPSSVLQNGSKLTS